MAHEVVLDLDRGDVLAPDLEHVLEPPGVAEVAALVDRAEVAGVEPALVVDRKGRSLGILEVALEAGVAAQAELAGLAGCTLDTGLGVDDLELVAGDDGAEGLDSDLLAVIGAAEGEVAGALRRSEGGDEGSPRHPPLQVAQPLGRRDALDDAQAAEVELGVARVVEDREPDQVEGGVGDGATLVLELVERDERVEVARRGRRRPEGRGSRASGRCRRCGTAAAGSQKRSSAVIRNFVRCTLAPWRTIASWVSRQPFGFAVVPDVYISTATSRTRTRDCSVRSSSSVTVAAAASNAVAVEEPGALAVQVHEVAEQRRRLELEPLGRLAGRVGEHPCEELGKVDRVLRPARSRAAPRCRHARSRGSARAP